jgi:hypothetical protein
MMQDTRLTKNSEYSQRERSVFYSGPIGNLLGKIRVSSLV